MKKILIAAAASGSGKTTFTMGLLRALRNRGLRVQPYKCGPDYIDTKWHTMASGRESVNLDTWLAPKEHVRKIFAEYGKDADICVTEGVMGLFDGFDRAEGSSADIAKTCGIPVVLLVNAKSTAYSVAPIIYGFKHFDPQIQITGVVFNQVASENHFSYLKAACEDAGVTCYGYLKKAKDIELPSRHLGLTLDEQFRIDSFIERIAKMMEETVDINALLDSIPQSSVEDTKCSTDDCVTTENRKPLHISIARDEAFNFTYRANIDWLKRKGNVTFFSPMKDKCIPEDTEFLYLPGGYPEFYLDQLQENEGMRTSVRQYVERGGRTYAECGGMLYLCSYIIGIDGKRYDMAGALKLYGTFENMKLHLGYRKLCGSAIAIHNYALSGHEFHYSDIQAIGDGEECIGKQLSARGTEVTTKLFKKKNTVAGYTHLYWAHLMK